MAPFRRSRIYKILLRLVFESNVGFWGAFLKGFKKGVGYLFVLFMHFFNRQRCHVSSTTMPLIACTY